MKAARSNPCHLPEVTARFVPLSIYGNQIQVFYSCIEIRRHNLGATRLEWVDLPWKVLLEQRELTPFPRASSLHEDSSEANRLIGLLNTTEDVLVFKIAMNALMEIVQGKGCRFLYPGERYQPELLAEAIEAAKEE